MKVLLLLAGRSRRFWPLHEKSLFPLCGKPLLGHQLTRLRQGGCNDIALVAGAHNVHAVKKLYPDLEVIEQEHLELGMRGALLSSLPHCGNSPVMVVSGNDIIDPSGYALLLQSEGDGAILARRVEQYFPGGYLTVIGDRIISIVEKPGEGNEPSDLVNIVAHVHRKPQLLLEALQNIDESRDDGYEQALMKILQQKQYHAVSYNGFWQAVKYPWHLLQLLPKFLQEQIGQSIHPSVSIHPSAVIKGDVSIGEDAKIMAHASVVGPCYIGSRSIVANNALVRGSSIGDDCVIGFSTEVKSSIFHSHIWTHMNYVGDSIVGCNVSLGGGSVTGNLRLDEEEVHSIVNGEKINTHLTKFGTVIGNNCRLGIHVSMNPGVKVGQGCFIATQALLQEDIPDEKFVVMKEGILTVRDNRTSAPLPEDRKRFKSEIV